MTLKFPPNNSVFRLTSMNSFDPIRVEYDEDGNCIVISQEGVECHAIGIDVADMPLLIDNLQHLLDQLPPREAA